MPAPRVFVSSTCYDLKYIRENLKFFIRNFGYEPVLSEEGAIFYDPSLPVQEACLAEVPSCQMCVLIIGGRFGGKYRDTNKSITNAEYNEAVRAKVPIFALVEQSVYDQHRVYTSNKDNPAVDVTKISYPAVDSTKIFDFIDEVRSQAINNALFPFSDFEGIQSFLKQQWASMMYRFLTSESEAKRVGNLFESLNAATGKIEFLSQQIVDSVANPMAKLNVELYDLMLTHEITRDLSIWQLRPSPKEILKNENVDDFCKGQIVEDKSYKPSELSITYGGPPYKASPTKIQSIKAGYKKLRQELLDRLAERSIPVEKFIRAV